jgi:hypothetical protein
LKVTDSITALFHLSNHCEVRKNVQGQIRGVRAGKKKRNQSDRAEFHLERRMEETTPKRVERLDVNLIINMPSQLSKIFLCSALSQQKILFL